MKFVLVPTHFLKNPLREQNHKVAGNTVLTKFIFEIVFTVIPTNKGPQGAGKIRFQNYSPLLQVYWQ